MILLPALVLLLPALVLLLPAGGLVILIYFWYGVTEMTHVTRKPNWSTADYPK